MPASTDPAECEPVKADESAETAQQPLDFSDCEILAPMVRAGTLPLRLECLRWGASLVFGEEIVDKKFLGAKRIENKAFGQLDFVSPREKVCVFSTKPEERSRVVFQLGTASGVLASEAAMIVCQDVRGIDVNMGCPKSFSVKGGMGAALLDTPEIAADILKTLRRNLPSSCALTCKIRMLATTAKTRDYMQLCERSGAEAITVHMRWRDERPVEPAHWDEMPRLWDAVQVPVMANGDFYSRKGIDSFWAHCKASCGGGRGPSGIMIARGALWNPAIFRRGVLATEAEPDYEHVVQRYVQAALSSNATYQNTKWFLSQMLAAGNQAPGPITFRGTATKVWQQKLSSTKNMGAICELVGLAPESAAGFPERAHMTTFYRDIAQMTEETGGEKRRLEGDIAEDAVETGDCKRAKPSESQAEVE